MRKIFENLEGLWSLERVISNKSTMSGTATFTRQQEGLLLYREDGTMMMTGGEIFKSFRDYQFLFQDNKIDVAFQDGKPFHTFSFARQNAGKIIATAEHRCGEDSYRAVYTFPDESYQSFTVHWSVHGPRKEYEIDTAYRRLRPG